jgi:hypothetical protein
LIVRTVLPEKAAIADIPLSERDRPVPFKNFNEWYPKGRVEVEPAVYDSPTTVFLHVLAPGEEGDLAPEVRLRDEGSTYGLRIGASNLSFDKTGRKLCRQA